ncbi:MAG: hypothetical protein LBK00_08725, partial [Treponema sp.]|nr:hypothetical protein [Treponema sp.]
MEVMTAEQAAEAGKSLDFAKVWAALMKTDEELRKSREQWQEEWQKSHEQWREELREQSREDREQWRKTRETVAETSRKVAELTKNVGGLNRSMGELIETLIAAKLWEKFDAYPYKLRRAYQRIPLFDEHNFTKTD